MPRLTRWCIKTALVYFLLALGVGVGMAIPSPLRSVGAALWISYVHLLVVGWITLLIVGVAFWLFPRHSRDRPYGPVYLGWIGYGLLAGGVLLRVVTEPFHASHASAWSAAGLVVSALAQWGGGLAFVVLLWTRVKAK